MVTEKRLVNLITGLLAPKYGVFSMCTGCLSSDWVLIESAVSACEQGRFVSGPNTYARQLRTFCSAPVCAVQWAQRFMAKLSR